MKHNFKLGEIIRLKDDNNLHKITKVSILLPNLTGFDLDNKQFSVYSGCGFIKLKNQKLAEKRYKLQQVAEAL
jgi:hypothetical protein